MRIHAFFRRAALASACVAMTASGLAAERELPPLAYAIRDKEPVTGSLIRRNRVYGSEVAINRQYADLPDAEKAKLAAYYEKMGPGDEPPFPIDGLFPVFDDLRRLQSKLEISSGRMLLLVEVDAKGEPIEVKVMESPDAKMTQLAASVLMLTKYKPAVCSGAPCRMTFPFAFGFSFGVQ